MSRIPRTLNGLTASLERWALAVPPLATGALMFAFGAAMAFWAHERGVAEDFARFSRLESQIASSVETRAALGVEQLIHARGLFDAVGRPSRSQFRYYARSCAAGSHHAGFVAMGYAPWVRSRLALAPLERAARREGIPGFHVWSYSAPAAGRTGEESAAAPIFYLESLSPSSARVARRLLGFDLASEPRRREALERARDSGRPAATRALESADKAEGANFLVFTPVYRGGRAPASVRARRAQLAGFLFGIFRARELLDSVLKETNAPAPILEIQASDSGPGAAPFYRFVAETGAGSSSGPSSGPSSGHREFGVHAESNATIADRSWILRADALPAFSDKSSRQLPWQALLASIVVAGLATSLHRLVKRRHAVVEASARQMRLMTDALPALVSYFDNKGTCRFANRAYRDWFGADPERVVGQPFDRCLGQIEPPGAAELAMQARDRALNGAVTAFECEIQDAIPARRLARVELSPDRRPDGAVAGFALLGADVTEDRARADAAKRWSETRAFLAAAGEALASSLEFADAVHGLARLATPRIADWCMIELLAAAGAGGSQRELRLASVSRDDGASVKAARLLRLGPPCDARPEAKAEAVARTHGESALDRAFRTRRAQLVSSEARHSAVVAPICAGLGAGVIGILTFFNSESERPLNRDDVELAEDLARRISMAYENSRLYAEARELNRLKDEFLATLSHELRTPLNILQGHSEILRDEPSESDQFNSSLDAIERNARALTAMVDDLLDVSSGIAGQLSVRPSRMRARSAVDAAVEATAFAARARGISVTVSGEEDLEILGDPPRIQQVMWNLLSNAVKFAHHGGQVRVEASRVGQFCRISVGGDGQGIDPGFLPYVFDRFRQEDGGLTRAHGGLGLGLAITRHLVELHGGSIEARSEGHGHGAEFIVRFPLAPQAQAAPAPQEPSQEPPAESAAQA